LYHYRFIATLLISRETASGAMTNVSTR